MNASHISSFVDNKTTESITFGQKPDRSLEFKT